jgi:hypothetical protein
VPGNAIRPDAADNAAPFRKQPGPDPLVVGRFFILPGEAILKRLGMLADVMGQTNDSPPFRGVEGFGKPGGPVCHFLKMLAQGLPLFRITIFLCMRVDIHFTLHWKQIRYRAYEYLIITK